MLKPYNRRLSSDVCDEYGNGFVIDNSFDDGFDEGRNFYFGYGNGKGKGGETVGDIEGRGYGGGFCCGEGSSDGRGLCY